MKCPIHDLEKTSGGCPTCNAEALEAFNQGPVSRPSHSGWICPRCGYVWAFWVAGCSRCNNQPTPQYNAAGSQP